MQKKPLGVYVHIPFCVRKCLYCDFLSGAAPEEIKARYVEMLLGEIERETEAARFGAYEVSTVYFGGGTPSLLSSEQIEMILCKLKERFRFGICPEISMEMNPGTVEKGQLEKLRRAGINRISIGVQSLQDGELTRLGRVHTAGDFYRIWDEAKSAGFDNRNVDLMTGIPGQTLQSLTDTLERLLRLRPEHISAYSLIVEEGTPFEKLYPEGAVDEDTDRLMYELTGRMLSEAGYERYEISNYAVPGFACRHNRAYWTRRDYIGFGIGAASLIGNTRFSNTRELNRYLAGETEHENVEELTVKERMAETMFLGLRLSEGVSFAHFFDLFGKEMKAVYGGVIQKHMEEGLLFEKNGCLCLTKRGLDVSNYVMADFL